MGIFDMILRNLAKFQYKYGYVILILALIFTAFTAVGATKIEMDGDIENSMPQHLPIYVLNDKITAKFSGQDTLFVLLMLDDNLETKNTPVDIRNPKIMEYIVDLEDSLIRESSIDSVISLAPFYNLLKQKNDNPNLEEVKDFFSEYSSASSLLSDDYKMTIVMISADVGSSNEKIIDLENLLKEKIDALSNPGGVEVMVSGTPSIIVTILSLLKHDAVYTLLLASVIILILLFVLQKSFSKGLLVFIPILFGIIWTMGTLGYLDLKINVATAGLGAMILGLGVEYGVFMLTRYHEERDKGVRQRQSILTAVPAVGSSILGSGTTTIIGFLALTLSIMPMLQKLGLSLALGIFYCIIAAVVLEPVIIIIEENFEYWWTHRKNVEYSSKRKKLNKKGK